MRVSNEQVKAEITCHAGNCGGCPFEGIDHCENNRCNDANAYLDLKEARELIKEMREALKHYADDMFYFPRGIVLECQNKGIRLAPCYSDFGKTAKEALEKSKDYV